MAYRKKSASRTTRRSPVRRSYRSTARTRRPTARRRSAAPRAMKLVIQVQQNSPAPMDGLYAPQSPAAPRRAKF